MSPTSEAIIIQKLSRIYLTDSHNIFPVGGFLPGSCKMNAPPNITEVSNLLVSEYGVMFPMGMSKSLK